MDFDAQHDKSKPVVLHADPRTNEDIDDLTMGLGLDSVIEVCVQLAAPTNYFWLRFVGVVRKGIDIKTMIRPKIP